MKISEKFKRKRPVLSFENFPPKKDFLHASDLTKYLRTKGDYCIAGACYPECHPESRGKVQDIGSVKSKVEAGDDFLITQLFFDNPAVTGRLCEGIRNVL